MDSNIYHCFFDIISAPETIQLNVKNNLIGDKRWMISTIFWKWWGADLAKNAVNLCPILGGIFSLQEGTAITKTQYFYDLLFYIIFIKTMLSK